MVTSLVGIGVLAGCGGDPGDEDALRTMLDRARVAALAAKTVEITAVVDDRGYQTRMELHLVHGRGGKGRVEHSDRSFDLIRIGSDLYIRGSGEAFGDLGTEAERLLKNRYLHVKVDDVNYVEFAAYLQWETFFDQLLVLSGQPDSVRVIDSRRSTGVVDQAGRRIIWLTGGDVARPMRVTALERGGSADVVEYSGYGKTVQLRKPRPEQIVELPELEAALTGGVPAAD